MLMAADPVHHENDDVPGVMYVTSVSWVSCILHWSWARLSACGLVGLWACGLVGVIRDSIHSIRAFGFRLSTFDLRRSVPASSFQCHPLPSVAPPLQESLCKITHCQLTASGLECRNSQKWKTIGSCCCHLFQKLHCSPSFAATPPLHSPSPKILRLCIRIAMFLTYFEKES